MMNTYSNTTATKIKIINFANPTSSSTGLSLRDNVLSTAGANRKLSVTIACDTVILYGNAEEAYTVSAVEQVTDAGGSNCVAFDIK